MPIRRITTDEAPAAKPVGVSIENLSTSWVEVIDAPEYDVPTVGLSSDRRIAPGVAEPSSPIIVTNKSTEVQKVYARIKRYSQTPGDETYSVISPGYNVPVNDALMLPIQGQFLNTGDVVEMRAENPDTLDVTLSYTEGQAEEDNAL